MTVVSLQSDHQPRIQVDPVIAVWQLQSITSDHFDLLDFRQMPRLFATLAAELAANTCLVAQSVVLHIEQASQCAGISVENSRPSHFGVHVNIRVFCHLYYRHANTATHISIIMETVYFQMQQRQQFEMCTCAIYLYPSHLVESAVEHAYDASNVICV